MGDASGDETAGARGPALGGGGVGLRRAGPADAGLIAAWREEPSTGRFMPNRRRSLPELEAMLAQRAAPPIDPELAETVQWIVEVGPEPVGWIRLTVTDRAHAVGEVGYTIGERFRGRGIATAALRAAVALAFAASGADLARLEAVAAVANVASRRVLEKAGFGFEGVARGLLLIGGARVDHARYGRLRTESGVGSRESGGRSREAGVRSEGGEASGR